MVPMAIYASQCCPRNNHQGKKKTFGQTLYPGYPNANQPSIFTLPYPQPPAAIPLSSPPLHKYLTLTSPIVTHDQKVSFPSPASFLSLSFIFISLSLLLFPFILPPNSCLPPPPWHCLSPLSPVPIQTLMHRHLLEGAFTFSPSPSRPSSHTPSSPPSGSSSSPFIWVT